MRFLAILVGAVAFAGPCRAAEPVNYLREVKPILAGRCTACHGALQQKRGLRLDTAALIRKGGKSGPAIVPGKSSESLLIEAVTGNGRPRMPPEKQGAALTAQQIATLRRWIDEGAKAPDEPIPPDPRQHWA
jgi:mono/diheme cytochrome c family protein